MKSAVRRLRIAMTIALILSLCLAAYLAAAVAPGTCQSSVLDARKWASEAVLGADTPEMVRTQLEVGVKAVRRMSLCQEVTGGLLSVYIFTHFGAVVLFVWSLVSLRRVERQMGAT